MRNGSRSERSHLNWELFDRAVGAANWAAIEELNRLGRERKLAAREATSEELQSLRSALEKPFADKLLLWQKTKNDLVAEMEHGAADARAGATSSPSRSSTASRCSRPACDRRSASRSSARTSTRSSRLARRSPPCSVESAARSNVVPDQIVGKGYIEIQIDRKKAARYGIQVGDIQDVVEVAMGGKPLTMTVEGRERYPVRVRYARAFRDDLESAETDPRLGRRADG